MLVVYLSHHTCFHYRKIMLYFVTIKTTVNKIKTTFVICLPKSVQLNIETDPECRAMQCHITDEKMKGRSVAGKLSCNKTTLKRSFIEVC